MEAFAKKKGKEGTRGAGQIMKENAATLVFYRNMIMGANAMYFATNTMTGHSYFTFDIIMFIISAISFIASFQMMRSMGQPADDTTPGLDLNMQGGLAEHLKVKISISLLQTINLNIFYLLQDLIILTAGSQALSVLSTWFWLLLLLAPLRGFLMLWTNVIAPWIFQPAPEEDEMSDKKRMKLDRKMKRAQR